MEPKNYWDKKISNFENESNCDNWLKNYERFFKNIPQDGIALDLGCGWTGCNINYLTQKMHTIACDISEVALNKTFEQYEKNRTENSFMVEFVQLDLRNKLPFSENSVDVIVADLSLHYFSRARTQTIINQIQSILKPGGYLFCRVNSIQSIPPQKIEAKHLEENYYLFKGEVPRRYFSMSQIGWFYRKLKPVFLKEYTIRPYGKKKIVFEFVCQKGK